MANQGNSRSNFPPQIKEINLMSKYAPQTFIQSHKSNYHPDTELDLTLSLSSGGSGSKCHPVLPKEVMVPTFSSATIGEGPTPAGRRMSWKQRAREAHHHVVSKEVPPSVRSEDNIPVPTISRRMSWKKRAREANQRVLPSVLSENNNIDHVPTLGQRMSCRDVVSCADPGQGAGQGKHQCLEEETRLKLTLGSSQPIMGASSSLTNAGTSSTMMPPGPAHEFDVKTMHMFRSMPHVTTGGGPNGTKVEGVLVSYLSGQVSIVCICHGRSMSPQEFVQHAGGGCGLEDPLRSIFVQPHK